MASSQCVAKVTDIPEGTAKVVELGGRSIAVFNIAGEFCACDSFCPKGWVDLSKGTISEEYGVLCPHYGWQFDLVNGRCCMVPGEHVKTYPVKVEGEEVWLEV